MASLGDIYVLVVDDNERMRFLLRRILRAGGIWRVCEADSAASAMEQMRASPADLAIIDWNMAPVDGLALTRMLRREPGSPRPCVPILMLTAHTEASRVAAARDAGVSGFVKKPVSARLLFQRIASALTDTRMFVRSADFFGPDRRRGPTPGYAGPFRRESDRETVDIDDLRHRA
jgi:CheY-like chemotaxis protein